MAQIPNIPNPPTHGQNIIGQVNINQANSNATIYSIPPELLMQMTRNSWLNNQGQAQRFGNPNYGGNMGRSGGHGGGWQQSSMNSNGNNSGGGYSNGNNFGGNHFGGNNYGQFGGSYHQQSSNYSNNNNNNNNNGNGYAGGWNNAPHQDNTTEFKSCHQNNNKRKPLTQNKHRYNSSVYQFDLQDLARSERFLSDDETDAVSVASSTSNLFGRHRRSKSLNSICSEGNHSTTTSLKPLKHNPTLKGSNKPKSNHHSQISANAHNK